MSYKKIGEYGVIGNGNTVALIGRDGALDWMCMPFMNSPSVFAAILEDDKDGRFSICPDAPFDSSQIYLPQTNILETRFRTADGEIELTDLMVADNAEHANPPAAPAPCGRGAGPGSCDGRMLAAIRLRARRARARANRWQYRLCNRVEFVFDLVARRAFLRRVPMA